MPAVTTPAEPHSHSRRSYLSLVIHVCGAHRRLYVSAGLRLIPIDVMEVLVDVRMIRAVA